VVVALSALLGGALALAAYAGTAPLVLTVLLVQGLLVSGWHHSLAVPGAAGGMVLAGATALAADLLLALRDDTRPLTPVTAVVGLAVVGALVHQLVRRSDRVRVTASLTATVTLAVLVVLAGFYLAALRIDGEAALVLVVALGAVVGRAALELPLSPAVTAVLGVAAGALLGLVLRSADGLGAGAAAALGGSAAAVGVVAQVVLLRVVAADRLASAALPLALAGPVAYVLGRLVVG
jgi:hypothetical protein